jgi:hypothetical protein
LECDAALLTGPLILGPSLGLFSYLFGRGLPFAFHRCSFSGIVSGLGFGLTRLGVFGGVIFFLRLIGNISDITGRGSNVATIQIGQRGAGCVGERSDGCEGAAAFGLRRIQLATILG